MISVRRSEQRGHERLEWLESRHTFSFGDYFDRELLGFRALRALNEETLQAGQALPERHSRDMEILCYVVAGSLEHTDDLGHRCLVHPGESQLVSAGTGIIHGVKNISQDGPAHFVELWISPERRGLTPVYAHGAMPAARPKGLLRALGSQDGRDGSMTIHQDVTVYEAALGPRAGVRHTIVAGRHAWLQVLRGRVALNADHLETGDGAAVCGEALMSISASTEADILLIDLA